MNDVQAPSDLLARVLGDAIAEVRHAARRVVASAGRGAARDAEAIHDYRVALRRLRTALRPARKAYGKKRLRRSEDELRAHARAAGLVRDEEVLHETLARAALLPTWRREADAWLSLR